MRAPRHVMNGADPDPAQFEWASHESLSLSPAMAEACRIRPQTVDELQHTLDVVCDRPRRGGGSGERPESQYGTNQVVRNLVHVDVGSDVPTHPGIDAGSSKQPAEVIEERRDDPRHGGDAWRHL